MKTLFQIKKIGVGLGLIGLMLTGQSCRDLLVETPISQVGIGYLSTPAGFEAAAKAAYRSLRDFYGREIGSNLTVFGTDTYTCLLYTSPSPRD